ncbi:MAG: hypothetical protein ABH810_03360 [bacterium]
MNLSTHVAVGAAVGYATKNPILGFFAGFLSHHIIDQIPHTDGGELHVDLKDFTRDTRIIAIVSIDFILLVFISILLFKKYGLDYPLMMGMFGGAFTDLIDNVPFWSPYLRKTFPMNYFHRFHGFFHFTIENKKNMWFGIFIQFLLIAISLKFLL